MMNPLDDDGSEGESGWEEGNALLATEAEVICPYCGEMTIIAVDPDGGRNQSYIEDGEVCCRPWQLQVTFNTDGVAHVHLEQAA